MFKDGFFCPLTHQHAPCRYAEELSTVGLVGCLKYCSSQARLALSGFSMFRLQASGLLRQCYDLNSSSVSADGVTETPFKKDLMAFRLLGLTTAG